METINPFFPNKNNHDNNINEILNDDEKIVKELNNDFQNSVSNLIILENSFIHHNKDYRNLSGPVQKAIAKCKHHPSVFRVAAEKIN